MVLPLVRLDSQANAQKISCPVLGLALPSVLMFLTLSSLILLGTLQQALHTMRLTSLDLRIARAERLFDSALDRVETYLRGDSASYSFQEPPGFMKNIQLNPWSCSDPERQCTQVKIYITHQLQDVGREWENIWYVRVNHEGTPVEQGWLP